MNAIKELTGKAWHDYSCAECGADLEYHNKFMRHPSTQRVGFLWLRKEPVTCPHAGKKFKYPEPEWVALQEI